MISYPYKKPATLSTLIHELDKLLSEVVRRSSADSQGYIKCISCEIRIHWTQAQCAHFVGRSKMATRFNLLNLAPACSQCNCFDEVSHLSKWAEKLGEEAVEYLRSEGRSMRKLMRYELEKGIELMTAKLKTLR